MIIYDTEEMQKYVKNLIEKDKYVAEDYNVIDLLSDTVTIKLVTKGNQCYQWQSRTVLTNYSDESIAHEVHHAAQHAKFGESDSAVFTSKLGLLALEVSALATGEAASGGKDLVRKIKDMLPIYHKTTEYQCDGGVNAALDYAFTKSIMLYSRTRLQALHINQADCRQ